MTKVAVKLKGEDRYGYVIEGDDVCKREEVTRYFVESGGTGFIRYDNFDRWVIKDCELDMYANPDKGRPITLQVGNHIFMG